jgi:hypothetical protein
VNTEPTYVTHSSLVTTAIVNHVRALTCRARISRMQMHCRIRRKSTLSVATKVETHFPCSRRLCFR